MGTPAPTTTTEGRRTSDDCFNNHRCIDGYCISEDIIEYWENNVQDWDMGLRRKRDAVDITAQLISAPGDGEIVPLVCEGDHCVTKGMSPSPVMTAQLIPAEGDGEIVPLVCEGDHCVAKDMSPSTDEPVVYQYQEERVEPAYVVPSIDEPMIYE